MRTVRLAAIAAILVFSISCDDGDTVIVVSDCGLVRTDLLDIWNVTVPEASAELFQCSNPAFNGMEVVFPSGITRTFADMEVFASSSNVGFFFRNSTRPEEIFGNVETDSCGMLFSLLVTASPANPTPLYLQCIGTLERQSGILNASCDSVSVLAYPLTDPVTVISDCDLSVLLGATITIP